jgi:hypothetical protein
VSSPVPVPLEAHDPDRARVLRLRIPDRVSDVRRHLVALRTAMAEFGEDFDLGAFQRAFESDDPVVLNRVKAVERGVDQLYNFIAELAALGLELAEVRVRREQTNVRADIDALARIGVIGPKRAASSSASTTPTGTGSPAASAPRATSDLTGRLRTAAESSASVCPRIPEATRQRASSRGPPRLHSRRCPPADDRAGATASSFRGSSSACSQASAPPVAPSAAISRAGSDSLWACHHRRSALRVFAGVGTDGCVHLAGFNDREESADHAGIEL